MEGIKPINLFRSWNYPLQIACSNLEYFKVSIGISAQDAEKGKMQTGRVVVSFPCYTLPYNGAILF